MWMKWLPWRMAIRRMVKKHGFSDPFNVIEQLERFAQPSEVRLPVEILRMGSGLQVRGLINSQAIQHNLDWVWPYWVERQFDPHDIAFVPRSFSVSHINLTHRNWTAVGIPDFAHYPIVDPAGLVTPFWDSWSVDSWMIDDQREGLIPSRLPAVRQKLLLTENMSVFTEAHLNSSYLNSLVQVTGEPHMPFCQIQIKANSDRHGWCVVSLRPYNPEGISFIHQIDLLKEHHGWKVNGKHFVYLSEAPDRCGFSDYRNGDVYHFLPHTRHRDQIICDVGMATAAAIYELKPQERREIVVEIPLSRECVIARSVATKQSHSCHPERSEGSQTKSRQGLNPAYFRDPSAAPQDDKAAEIWTQNLANVCELKIPDAHFQFLYEAALKNMILHAPEEVYPGPYTYKHFWFRDAAFILNAMLSAGLFDRVEKVIDHSFFSRQTRSGYFHSQDGEWDSNGEALWMFMRFCELTGKTPKPKWKQSIQKAAQWIYRKRIRGDIKKIHTGLLPPGYSAEHLGPNDYYYWDDFWGVAGLASAGYLMEAYEDSKAATRFYEESANFLEAIEHSLKQAAERLGHQAMPASPYRRMDSGAIGSLVAGYPLRLWEPKDRRLLETVEYLMKNCLVDGGFFHDMSHSGINPYLTLNIAQVLLRAEDPRYFDLMKSIAALASPTGQWPEAIHPKTKGGCMGDGQHIWAAAEWVSMIRNCFVREEDDRLILFSGIPASWLWQEEEISFGPAPTKFGTLCLTLKHDAGKIEMSWKGQWFGKQPKIEICLPGFEKMVTEYGQTKAEWPTSPICLT